MLTCNGGRLEYTAADMSLSALYMHELHHRSAAAASDKSHISSRRGYPPPGGNVAIPASAGNVMNDVRNSFNSNLPQSISSGSHGQRKHKKNSLRELEEESLPLVDHTTFNSSSLEINADSSSASSSTTSSGSYPKGKKDLIHV